jgi:hypothetical protein
MLKASSRIRRKTPRKRNPVAGLGALGRADRVVPVCRVAPVCQVGPAFQVESLHCLQWAAPSHLFPEPARNSKERPVPPRVSSRPTRNLETWHCSNRLPAALRVVRVVPAALPVVRVVPAALVARAVPVA